MNSLATRAPGNGQLTVASDNDAIRTALKSSLYPGASNESVDLVIAYCRAAGLDPMAKPVHIVPMKVNSGKKDNRGYDVKEMRDVVMPGIGLYRINAARTGEYAGMSEPEFGPTKTLSYKREIWVDGEGDRRQKKFVDATLEYPEWCRVTVKRVLGDRVVEFTAIEYWLENYATKGDSSAPNAMWEKRPRGQLAKCTEAQALRKGFPEAVGSQPTAEEMEGKTDAIEGEYSEVAREPSTPMPASKSGKTDAAPAKETASAAADAKPAPPAQGARTADKQKAAPAPAPAPAPAAEAGVHLDDGPSRLLTKKIDAAGLKLEAVLQQFPRIDITNLNDVFAWLREQQEAAAKE
jgi:phage recombination protein Bet